MFNTLKKWFTRSNNRGNEDKQQGEKQDSYSYSYSRNHKKQDIILDRLWFTFLRYLPFIIRKIFKWLFIITVCVWLIWLSYQQAWTGFNSVQEASGYRAGKYLWDWLDLLTLPAVILILGNLFIKQRQRELEISRKTKEQEKEIADEVRRKQLVSEEDQRRAKYLQSYLNHMKELVLNGNLYQSKPGDPVRHIARAITLSVLPSLDSNRKSLILRYLIEGNLIRRDDPLVDLHGADLREISFSEGVEKKVLGLRYRFDIPGINLSFVDLRGANISECDLSNSDLSGAFFFQTDLTGTDLAKSDLTKARFDGARIGGVSFNDACLSQARFYNIYSGINRFINADLSSCYFSNVSIHDYDFYGSNLEGARIESDCNFYNELKHKVHEYPTEWPPKRSDFIY